MLLAMLTPWVGVVGLLEVYEGTVLLSHARWGERETKRVISLNNNCCLLKATHPLPTSHLSPVLLHIRCVVFQGWGRWEKWEL